jgi:hypothetical protein
LRAGNYKIMLTGVSTVSGDCQHTIATTRMRSCPTTRAYVARRTAQGKNPKEIRRCLKRYIARQLYRTLTAAMTKATKIS